MPIRRLKEALDEIPGLEKLNHGDPTFDAWRGRLVEVLRRNWSDERLPEFSVPRIRLAGAPMVDGRDIEAYRRGLVQSKNLIERVLRNESDLAEARGEPGIERFLPPGSQHDAYQEIRHIVAGAHHELIIVDNYVDSSLFQLLLNSSPAARTRLLTFSVPTDFALEARKFIQQHGRNLEVRRDRSDFHDRFIIRDGNRVFHLGHSIKDAGSKAMMIHRVEDERNVAAAIQTLEVTWNRATVFPIGT